MKMCTVEELQKNLQTLANQVGSKRFTAAKNLMLEGLVIVDADGNPVDPSSIKYEVTLSPAEPAVEEDAVHEMETPVVEEPKALADEVAKAVKLELSPTRQPLTQSQPERKSQCKEKFTRNLRTSTAKTKHTPSALGRSHVWATRSLRNGAPTTASSPRSQTSKATMPQAVSSFQKPWRTRSSRFEKNSESSETTLELCR